MPVLSRLAELLAKVDVFCAYALLAQERNYCKPEISEGNEIRIVGGRHPVIEAFLPKDQPFISNGLAIGEKHTPQKVEKKSSQTSSENGLIHIITGPNMGGKSTFLRQSALIVLLAHCGLYVPAQEAKI